MFIHDNNIVTEQFKSCWLGQPYFPHELGPKSALPSSLMNLEINISTEAYHVIRQFVAIPG